MAPRARDNTVQHAAVTLTTTMLRSGISRVFLTRVCYDVRRVMQLAPAGTFRPTDTNKQST
eukprot:3262799-Pyramimonas_sp.AAC.1